MDPSQTPAPGYPGNYPPQTPAPQPAAAPETYPQPTATPYQQPTATPQTPRPAPAPPSSWYTPALKPDAYKPGDVDSYLQQPAANAPVAAPQGQSPQGATVPGQVINGQYAVDYLDQMAAPPKAPLDKRFIFAAAGGVLALIIAAFLIFGNQKTASVTNEVKLYTTMVDVENSTNRSKSLIKNSTLAAINGNMRTTLVNATRDMETPLTNMGQDPTKLSSAGKTGQYNDGKFDAALEDARLNGTYDRVYANEVDTKMKYMIAYMENIKKNNKRKSMQEFISKNENSIKTIQKSIDDWSKSDEANLY